MVLELWKNHNHIEIKIPEDNSIKTDWIAKNILIKLNSQTANFAPCKFPSQQKKIAKTQIGKRNLT